MKIKKILAAVAASAMALSTMVFSAAGASAYTAYLGVQTNPNWIFRNGWNDGTFGRDNYSDFNSLSKDGKPADIAGTFTDVEVTADGTYKVSLTGADLSDEEIFSQLFVSTDIPVSDSISVTNVKVIIDGNTKYTFDEGYLNPDEKEYVQITAINIWNPDLQDLFGYVMPNDTVEMEFTISGLDAAGSADAGDAGAADAGEAETSTDAPASDGETSAATTGNVPAAVMASVMAVAGVAVVASRKRK